MLNDRGMKYDVSIVIVNYNTASLLCDCITSVFDKTKVVSFELIVVDNNSSEELGPILNPIHKEKVQLIRLPENIGFGRANNEGIKQAKGRNVFFLNPDTILLNDAVSELSRYLDAHGEVGACGGNLFDKDLQPIHSHMPSFPSWIWELNQLGGDFLFHLLYGKHTQFNYSTKVISVGYVTGADMMVRNTCLEECGVFDPDFFMYYEETELSYRIKQKSYSIVNVPTAKIIHLEGQSVSTNDRREAMKSLSRKLYYKKTRSRFNFCLANSILTINCLFKISVFGLIGNQSKKEYWKIIYRHI